MARKNFAVASILTAPSPATSGTSVVVNSGMGTILYTGKAFYVPANFNPLTDTAEEITISNISTDTLTITRNTDSRGAASMVVGGIIRQGMTALQADKAIALDVMTTAGDIITGGASGVPARLAMGSALQVLRVNSGATALEYATPSSGAGNPQDKYKYYFPFTNLLDSAGGVLTKTGTVSISWSGGQGVQIQTSATNDKIEWALGIKGNATGLAMFDKVLAFRTVVQYMTTTSTDLYYYWRLGSNATNWTTQKTLAFYCAASNNFYASNNDGTAETKTDVKSGFTFNGAHCDCIAIHNPTVNDLYYNKNNLLATHTTNVPAGNGYSSGMSGSIKSQANNANCNTVITSQELEVTY